MFGDLRHTLGVLLAIVIGVLVQAAPAAAAGPPGSPCSASTVSAMNQYCEEIPSPSGSNSAGPGTPALASKLPPAEVSALRGGSSGSVPGATGGGGTTGAASGSSARGAHGKNEHGAQPASRVRSRLLTLPAPGPRVGIAGGTLPHTSEWSLLTAVIGVVAGMSVVAGGLAVLARRRARIS